MKNKKIINTLFLIAGIVFLLYYIACGVLVRFGQSLLWLWPCASVFCFVRYFLVRSTILKGKPFPIPRRIVLIFRIAAFLCLAVFFFVEGFIVSHSFILPDRNLDCIIILGAKVNGDQPSGALWQRITAAADYLNNNPETICIASGGQGEDEGISEAECMRRNLLLLGISDDRILTEDQSTDTASNLRNSFALFPDGIQTVGILTNDFHVFRAISMAESTDAPYRFCGIPARSSVSGYVHYSMREFFSIGLAILRGNLSPSCLIP